MSAPALWTVDAMAAAMGARPHGPLPATCGAGVRILLHDLAGFDLVVGLLVLLHAKGQGLFCERRRRVVDRATDE